MDEMNTVFGNCSKDSRKPLKRLPAEPHYPENEIDMFKQVWHK